MKISAVMFLPAAAGAHATVAADAHHPPGLTGDAWKVDGTCS